MASTSGSTRVETRSGRLSRRRAPRFSLRRLPVALLAAVLLALGAGGALWAAGAHGGANIAFDTAAIVGAAEASSSMLRALLARRLGIDVIAVLALLGALAVAEHLAAAVIGAMVATGQWLEAWAEGRADRDLRALVERTPRTAHRRRGATLESVDSALVECGDTVVVATGEVVPVDGTVLTPLAVLDESALTGESMPVEHVQGDAVRSGVVNAGAPFDLEATASAAESTQAAIGRLVVEAEASKAPLVRLADRYAVLFLAVTGALAGTAWALADARRAVAVLVVATPCPLILAAPIAIVAGLARAAHRGVIVKGGAVLERLARVRTLLIDKTGTLTRGRPELRSIVAAGEMKSEEILFLAASLDQVSNHVLARPTVEAARRGELSLKLPEQVEEVAGRGIRGLVGGRRVLLGNGAFAGVDGVPNWLREAERRAGLAGAVAVFVSVDEVVTGALVFEDPLRSDANRAMRALRNSGTERIVIVSGDRPEVAEAVGAALGVDEVLAGCSPAAKLEVVAAERERATTMMVGDGINDAPALALADVGVAMGARGATVASEAADVVLMVDRVDRIGEAVTIARRARRIALQSVLAGMGLSLVAMAAAAAGLLPAVWGALLQEGIDVAVIINALRALRPVPGGVRPTERQVEIARRFEKEHAEVRRALDGLRRAGDSLGVAPPAEALARVREVQRLLEEEVLPHEQAEQAVLYPEIEQLLGGTDATATMSRAHHAITQQIGQLAGLLDELGADGPDQSEMVELRNLLYGLRAILELHTIQEEESYLSLFEEEASGVRLALADGRGRHPKTAAGASP